MEQRADAVVSPGGLFHGVYEVRRCLEVGGMAIVYDAVHTVTRRACALKVLRPSVASERGMHERFALEARIPAEIRGEHIVEVFDAGVDDATGSPFLVMELLHGEDLEAVIRRRGGLPSSEVVALLRQAALALEATHAARIVHRDLKPSNLFLAEARRSEGGEPSLTLKILDFGIAKIVDGSGGTTRNLGTPVYMSPEQVRGDGAIGPGADVYALGHVAFALLVGTPYWRDESVAGGRLLFDRVESGATESARARAARRGVELPETFDAWFEQATAREPEDRFESSRALVDALAHALAGQASAQTASHRHGKSEARVERRPRGTSVRARAVPLFGVIALGVAGGVWAFAARSRVGASPLEAGVQLPEQATLTDRAGAPPRDVTSSPEDGHATPTHAPPRDPEDVSPPITLRTARVPVVPRATSTPSTSPSSAPRSAPPGTSSSASPFGPGAF